MMEKNLAYYMALPYTIEIIPDLEDGGWVVRVKELPGCISQGDTPEEVFAMIEDAKEGWLETSLEDGYPIPEPRLEEEYSGKFVVRVPKSLHQALVEEAEEEGVSLNQFIATALAGALRWRQERGFVYSQPLPDLAMIADEKSQTDNG